MSQSTFLHGCIIVVVAAALFFISLGQARFWDRDEPRNAGCAAEMLNRGDLIVPIFNDELRHQKPVLLYWLMISAYSVFGVNEFAARFWSAILSIGTVLLTYQIALRMFDRGTALLSSIALASSVMFCVAARAATPDATLIFFSTLGIYFYVVGTFARQELGGAALKFENQWFPKNIGYVFAMNSAFALGVLTKGPIGLIIPTAIIGMFLLIVRAPAAMTAEQRATGWATAMALNIWRVVQPDHFVKTVWAMRPLTAIGIGLLIATPWYVAVGLQTNGDFTRLFFLNENFARATSVMESHSGPWWYYLAAIAVGFFPWSVFLLPVAVATDRQLARVGPERIGLTLMLCWVAVQIGLFSLAETKLPSYVTPCYPALAILTAFGLTRGFTSMADRGRYWQIASMSTFALAGIGTFVGLLIGVAPLFPEIRWVATLGLIPLAGGAVAIWLLARQQLRFVTPIFAAAAVAFCGFMFAVGTVAVDSQRQTEQIWATFDSQPTPGSLAAYHCLESSWVYYAGRPIYELHRGEKSDQTPTSLARDAHWQTKPVLTPEDFVAADVNAALLTTNEHVEELLSRLPPDFGVSKQVDFFLKSDQQLVLIQRQPAQQRITAAANDRNETRSR